MFNYKINGIDLKTQPSTGQYLERKQVGIDGEGRAIYVPTYAFMMRWDAMTVEDFDQLFDFWNTTSSTGTTSQDARNPKFSPRSLALSSSHPRKASAHEQVD